MKVLTLLLVLPIGWAQAPASPQLRWGGFRGANINHQFTDEDAKVLAGWGANVVRINFHQLNLMRKAAPYEIDMEAVRRLDEILDICERNGLRAILDPHTTPGTQSATSTAPSDPIWRDFVWHDHLIRLWRFLAQRYKDRGPVIAGYDLLNEPSPPRGEGREGTPADWNLLVRKLVAAIREWDTAHTLVIEFPIFANAPGGLPPVEEMVEYLEPVEDRNAVYSVHWYAPGEFTHQGVDGRPGGLRYPGFYRSTTWNKALHQRLLEPVAAFQHRHNVPIYLGEFAAARWAGEDGNRWMRDVAEIAERYGWSWTYHSFRIASVWDAEKSNENAQDEQRYAVTPRIELLRDLFAGNRAPRPRIAGVVDGASFRGDALAPYQLFSIFGEELGPTEALGYRLDRAGEVARGLGCVEVLFDGKPAPLLFAGPRQVNGVVPEIAEGREKVALEVRCQDRSVTQETRIVGARPALFTVDGKGAGQAVATNGDGSWNSGERPARRQETVSIYLTGGGVFTEAIGAGAIAGGQVAVEQTPSVFIGGERAEVRYAGAAPGFVAGMIRIEAAIPGNLPAGREVAVRVEAGGMSSQGGVTIAVE
jgi:uncharacterized protein (TIGR03437 family)